MMDNIFTKWSEIYKLDAPNGYYSVYLKDNLSVIELEEIIEKLGINSIDLVRKKEQIWIENYKNKDLSSKEIVKVMVENPKIIERPIVVKGKNAIIGRPPENVLSLLL